MSNAMWRLARTPGPGLPSKDDFVWADEAIPVPAQGQLLSRTIYLSLDPYQWVRRRSGTEQPGDVCHGRTVSLVLESRMPGFLPGDYLFNTNGWQTFGLTGEGIDHFGYMFPRKLDPDVAPISTAVGVLGMLGLTAYAGLIVQCAPRAGETVVVSAASGGVGQVVAQLARIEGCRVVGVASTPEKCAYVVDEIGADACVPHRAPDFPERLRNACPDGVDVYFENVGGHTYEAVLPLLNDRARISVCGMIAQYGDEAGGSPRERWLAQGSNVFEARSVAVHDLFVGNFVESHQAEFLSRMVDWVRDGLVVYKEHVWQGLEQAPVAFAAMTRGGNFGKTLVAVSEDPTG